MRKLCFGVIERFFRNEDGPTSVEYAVMLALIILACFTAIGFVGNVANEKFENVGLRGVLAS